MELSADRLNLDDMATILRQQVESFRFTLHPVAMGTVTEVGDGIARISGLTDVMVGKCSSSRTKPWAWRSTWSRIMWALLSWQPPHREGTVRALGRLISALWERPRRVVKPWGQPIDEKPHPHDHFRPVERMAARVIDRAR